MRVHTVAYCYKIRGFVTEVRTLTTCSSIVNFHRVVLYAQLAQMHTVRFNMMADTVMNGRKKLECMRCHAIVDNGGCGRTSRQVARTPSTPPVESYVASFLSLIIKNCPARAYCLGSLGSCGTTEY